VTDHRIPDYRIVDVKLDERTIIWRNADVEQERRVAIFDLLEGNSFKPLTDYEGGYAGPYKLVLRVEADGLGNFYTTEKLPLPDMPVFPTVYSADGERSNFMPFPTRSAACNVCHVGSAVIRFKE